MSPPSALRLGNVVLLVVIPLLVSMHSTRADIYRMWSSNVYGEVIPGTEGITPGPGVQLDHMQLEYAGFRETSGSPDAVLDLTLANFEAPNLPGARFERSSRLTNANLKRANLTNAWFFFPNERGRNRTGANLTNANLDISTLTNANLTGANLKNASLGGNTDFTLAKFSPASVYSQWTVFRTGFNPTAAGLTMVMSPKGDLDANDTLDAADVDMLANRIDGRWNRVSWLPDAAFDMNGDSRVSVEDHRAWVHDLAHTWYGDADLDGEFSTHDLVYVFAAGKYEHEPIEARWNRILNPVSWSEGDWNGDSIFGSDDFIIAFQDGGYEQGLRTDVAAVPEPGMAATAIASLAVVTACCRWRKRRARSASYHLYNQPIPRRAVGILKAKMAKWSLWPVG